MINRENNTKNSLIGCICRHPKQDTDEVTEDLINPCLDGLSIKNKPTLIMGDFTINLLNCDSDNFKLSNTSSFDKCNVLST